MWVTHSGSSGSSTVYIDRVSATGAANVADNNRNMAFFNPEIPGLSHGNPGISGLEKWAGIPGFGIPGLQSLFRAIEEYRQHTCGIYTNFC